MRRRRVPPALARIAASPTPPRLSLVRDATASGPSPPAPSATRPRARPGVLGSGTRHYGPGSIMRGGIAPARSSSIDASRSSRSPASFPAPPDSLQEVTRAGNELYKKGWYGEALRHNDRALTLCPDSAACRGNRAATLTRLGHLAEALHDCEEAIRIDPASGRAHGRLAAFCLWWLLTSSFSAGL